MQNWKRRARNADTVEERERERAARVLGVTRPSTPGNYKRLPDGRFHGDAVCCDTPFQNMASCCVKLGVIARVWLAIYLLSSSPAATGFYNVLRNGCVHSTSIELHNPDKSATFHTIHP